MWEDQLREGYCSLLGPPTQEELDKFLEEEQDEQEEEEKEEETNSQKGDKKASRPKTPHPKAKANKKEKKKDEDKKKKEKEIVKPRIKKGPLPKKNPKNNIYYKKNKFFFSGDCMYAIPASGDCIHAIPGKNFFYLLCLIV